MWLLKGTFIRFCRTTFLESAVWNTRLLTFLTSLLFSSTLGTIWGKHLARINTTFSSALESLQTFNNTRDTVVTRTNRQQTKRFYYTYATMKPKLPCDKRFVIARLVIVRLVTERLVTARLVTERLVTSRFFTARLVSARIVTARIVTARLVTVCQVCYTVWSWRCRLISIFQWLRHLLVV